MLFVPVAAATAIVHAKDQGLSFADADDPSTSVAACDDAVIVRRDSKIANDLLAVPRTTTTTIVLSETTLRVCRTINASDGLPIMDESNDAIIDSGTNAGRSLIMPPATTLSVVLAKETLRSLVDADRTLLPTGECNDIFAP